MTEHDPKRLLDRGADPGALRSLLEAGRSEMPNDRQMMMLAAKVGVLGGLGGAGAAGAGGAGGAGGVGAAGAGGAGAKAAVGAATAMAAKTSLAIKVVAVAVTVAAVVAAAAAVVVANRTAESVAAPVGIVATSAPTGIGTSTSTSTSAPTSTSESAPTSTSESIPTSTSESTTPARSVATRAPNVASAAAKDEGPETEVKLLERAQDALRSRPAEALALCNDHAKRFPSGMLVQEREVIAIEALLKTGRKDDARARADKFKARFPGSSHARRLETLLAN